MFEELFYQRLSKLRAEKGVSARDMSLSIGQSAGYINALENRAGFPSMQVFSISVNTWASPRLSFSTRGTAGPLNTGKS